MITVNSESLNHSISFVPRYIDVGTDLTINIKKDGFNDETQASLSFTYLGGYVVGSFTYSFQEKTRYSISVSNHEDIIIYRGLLMAVTNDTDTQNYKENTKYYV